MKRFLATLGAVTLTASLPATARNTPPPLPAYDRPAILNAQSILSPELHRNRLFTIQPEVPSREGVNEYSIVSEVGTFTARGNLELIQRATEIHAIAKLREISRSDSYKAALRNAVESPLKLTRKAIRRPVETVDQVSQGLWKRLNGLGQSIKEAGQGRTRSIYEDSAMQNAIGFSAAKREIALALGVDPYSTNEVLQEELKEVAWASFAGKMTFAGALFPISGPAGVAIKTVNAGSNSLEALRDLDPADLRLHNLKHLRSLGFSRAEANAFLNNPALSPTHQTLIVEALLEMPRVGGRKLLIQRATAVTTELQANRCQRVAQLLSRVNTRTPFRKLVSYNGIPMGLTADGKLVAALEWDYAQWTPASHDFLLGLNTGEIEGEKFNALDVYLSGTASPAAKAVLASCGISLYEKALPGPLTR